MRCPLMSSLVIGFVLVNNVAFADGASETSRAKADETVKPYVCGRSLEFEYAPDAERLHEMLLQELPSWSLFLTGHSSATHPRDLDRESQMVAIRQGDEDRPERWVVFSLTNAWLEGSKFYFDDLIEEGKLTVLDLVGISFALARNGENELPLLPYSIIKDSTGTGPDLWGAFRPAEPYPYIDPVPPRRSGSSPAPGNHGPISNPHRTTPLPTWAPPPAPIPANNGSRSRDHENGVDPSDSTPPRRFYDDTPAPCGVNREVFRCEGEVYYGYRDRCIDFARVSTQERWSKKMDGTLREYFRRHLFNDGRNPECSDTCDFIGAGMGAAWTGLLLGGCATVTAGTAGVGAAACGVGYVTSLLASMSGTGVYLWYSKRCKMDFCNGR